MTAKGNRGTLSVNEMVVKSKYLCFSVGVHGELRRMALIAR